MLNPKGGSSAALSQASRHHHRPLSLRHRSVQSRRGAAATAQQAPSSSSKTEEEGSQPRILIVGGGPAGCLCAALLAQRGYPNIDVFEQRQAPKPSDARSHRSYPMVLSSRSAMGLKAADLDLPLPEPQLCIFMPNGKLEMLWEDSDYCRQYIVDRVDFGRHMYEATSRRFGSAISFHWGHSLQQVDFDRRLATFTSSTDPQNSLSQGSVAGTESAASSTSTVTASYDFIIGADGAGSKLRQIMQEAMPDLNVELVFHNRSNYKTFHGLACNDETHELVPGFSTHEYGRYLYTFNAKDMPTLVLWRQRDQTASGMLTRAQSYDAEDLRSRISTAYPMIPKPWVESIVAQTCDASGQPPSPFGKLMSTTKLDGPRCVLLGDAGHPMTSTLAQGCNLALESVRAFISSLDQVSGDLDKAPAAFTAARIEDVHAMQTIEYMQILNSNAPGAKAHSLERLHAKAVMRGSAILTLALHKLMPGMFPAPFYLLDGLRDARVPYRQVLQTMQMHAAALVTMAAAAVSGAMTGAGQLAVTFAELS